MSAYLHKFRYAATGRWAVSLRTYLLVFPFGYVVSTERELIYNPTSLSRAALIALAGEFVSFLYLFIAQNLFLGDRKNSLQPIWRCIFVWSSTGFVRGLCVAAYAHWAFGYDWLFLQRIPSATGYTTIGMALAATYFGTIERRRTEYQALISVGELLADEEIELLAQDIERRKEAQGVLEGELLPQVTQLQEGIREAISSSKDENSDQILHGLYDRSLRISRELDAQRKIFEAAPVLTSRGFRDSEKVSYWAALTPSILSVRITILLFTLGTFSGQLPRNGLEGVSVGLLGIIPVLVVVIPFSQIIKRVKRHRFLLFFATFMLTFGVSYIYNTLQPHIGFTLNHPYAPWYSAAKTIYGLYFASVIASLLVDFGDKKKRATSEGETRKNSVDQLSIRNYSLEKAAFSGRFGTLQGKISGVTMALHLLQSQSLGQISEERKLTLLQNANDLLAEGLNEINSIKVEAF